MTSTDQKTEIIVGVKVVREFYADTSSVADNQISLQDLVWSIEMSQGQFSLILVCCNSVALRGKIAEYLRQECPAKIRYICLKPSTKKLYSTIQEQLGKEQPAVLMVYGLESVNAIDQLLLAANQIREEFRKNFYFPLILWVNDDIVRQLIRLAPDLESWTTHTYFHDEINT